MNFFRNSLEKKGLVSLFLTTLLPGTDNPRLSFGETFGETFGDAGLLFDRMKLVLAAHLVSGKMNRLFEMQNGYCFEANSKQ